MYVSHLKAGSNGADTLAFQEYSKAIDVWSVGCILAEMSESWEGMTRI